MSHAVSRSAGSGRRRLGLPSAGELCAAALFAGAVCLTARTLQAQERIVTSRLFGAGASYESITFGGDGLAQTAFGGLDSTRITRVRQYTLPITAAIPRAGDDRMRSELNSVTLSDVRPVGAFTPTVTIKPSPTTRPVARTRTSLTPASVAVRVALPTVGSVYVTVPLE